VIEAKREEEGHRMNVHEGQASAYANAKLKHLKNEPLPFVSCFVQWDTQPKKAKFLVQRG
ncbi:MAG: hypothetical protein ACK5HE_10650, partial [Bacteroidota bacterium]